MTSVPTATSSFSFGGGFSNPPTITDLMLSSLGSDGAFTFGGSNSPDSAANVHAKACTFSDDAETTEILNNVRERSATRKRKYTDLSRVTTDIEKTNRAEEQYLEKIKSLKSRREALEKEKLELEAAVDELNKMVDRVARYAKASRIERKEHLLADGTTLVTLGLE